MSKKQNEKDYLKKIGIQGKKHTINKPYGDKNCGGYLSEIGAIISLLPNIPQKIIDVGCGSGWTSIIYGQMGHDVLGVDISEDMIFLANEKKEKSNLNNINFSVEDFELLPYKDEFDCVIFFDSLHHSENLHKAIEESFKVLKKGGICILSEPGLFHSHTKSAKNAIKKYGVNELSILPRKVIKIGKKIGFNKFNIYPRMEYLNWALYSRIEKLPDIRIIKFLFQSQIIRMITAVFLILIYRRFDGIVVMKK